jgi:hypothetical protein
LEDTPMTLIRRACYGLALLLCTTSVFGETVATVTQNVNLRATPSTAQNPIRLLTPPEVLTVISLTQVNGYYHVKTSQGEDGWVFHARVHLGTALPALTCGPGTEIVPHSSCPAVGEHRQSGVLVAFGNTTDAGLRNLSKRHLPDPACVPKPFALDDARSLQNYIDNTFADARTTKTKFEPTRSLSNIPAFNGTLSEGDLVKLSAYLIKAHDEGSESVNCAGNDGTDIHISVGPQSPHTTEFDGIVAEMIPQLPRPVGWDTLTLNRLAGKQVLIVGNLSYDNEHFVNENAANPKPGQPKRFSLWEIHPITEFFVCPAGDWCDPDVASDWLTLTAWAMAHP